ncbi:uncharacterized protein LOC117179141 isoform X2 [Belonocnema kinseyi]|uniref:uncharacterized protein LOC117179141 isoform X2 n=1 Tax=Belonocnema kinseyi TaxID=2817044 RepID=UPI00143D2612|nr:uncharacterized protein LOC117179141 isoform X2 [Belonocnema kinseyi]
MKMNGSSVDVVWDPQTQMSSLDCWDYSIELACLQGPEDLQLAAELGKTLLERNKELENTIRSQQNTIEEQSHEIEYMKKQTAALREVNDSRLKIYEQLEVSIQDLERANHLLVVDNANEKKVIKSQVLTIETLENRYDELQKKFDELKTKHQALVRQQAANEESQAKNLWKVSSSQDDSIKQSAASNLKKQTSEVDGNVQQVVTTMVNDEEVVTLLKQLTDVRSQRAWEQKKVAELEVQLASLLHENTAMEEQLNVWRNKAQDVKNLQDELSTLEEVRQGHLCGRCLRGMNVRNHEELTLMLDRNGDIPEVDDMSLADSLVHENHENIENSDSLDTNNKVGLVDDILDDACTTFVGSYKSFMEVKGYSTSRLKTNVPNPCLSLQEELKMSGEFNNFQAPSEPETHPEDKISNKSHRKTQKSGKKAFSGTPTDFSEAETLSSGFSDETSNKSTQTDGRPGSLLCSIADGDNCKLSIYDDNSTFESRFNQTPEYRQIFSEIFSVLKRAAEAKIEGEKLPQANSTEISNTPNFPSVDDGSETTDDTQSVMSSTISSVVSEPVFRVHAPIFERRHRPEGEKTEPALRPLHNHKRQQLDYLSIQTRKKSLKKSTPKKSNLETPSTPDIIPTTNPKVMHAKSNSGGKRKFRPLTSAELDGGVWNGHTTHFYSSRNRDRRLNSNSSNSNSSFSRNSSDQSNSSFEYRDYKPSAASQEIAKLKRLDMSYAEVLRMPNKPKGNHMRRS